MQKIFHPDSGSRDTQLQGAIFSIMRPIHPNLKEKFTSPGNYFHLYNNNQPNIPFAGDNNYYY